MQVALLVVEGISAGFQASLAVDVLREVREYQDLHARLLRAHRAQNLQPTAVYKLNIQQDDVGWVASNACDGRRGSFELAHHFRPFDPREHLAQHRPGNG